jgi:CRISPR/Cas system-associated exonuclease Cas4 (RecB family)
MESISTLIEFCRRSKDDMIDALIKDRDEALAPQAQHFSHSRVSRYLLCPEQYRLYYLEKLRPVAPSASLVFGQLIHQSLAHLFGKTGDPVKHFMDTWTALKDMRLQYAYRESWEKLQSSGESLLNKFVAHELQRIANVRCVERPFELRVTGLDVPFVGIIDLAADVEGKPTVVDFKTSGSAYDEHEAALADQLTAYNLAEPTVAQLALCVLVKTKEPKIEWHMTSRTGTDLSEYLAKLGFVAREITVGRFFRRPGMWCAWCDYLSICLGDHQKAKETLVVVS